MGSSSIGRRYTGLGGKTKTRLKVMEVKPKGQGVPGLDKMVDNPVFYQGAKPFCAGTAGN